MMLHSYVEASLSHNSMMWFMYSSHDYKDKQLCLLGRDLHYCVNAMFLGC